MTIENLTPEQEHTITFKATKSLFCITNIKFLENASDYASARIQVFSDKISSTVQKDGIISAINQTAESVKIEAAKISFNGLVTANNYFKINTDGSMVAKAGTIAGWKITPDGFEKGGMEIHNTGSIADEEGDFSAEYTTCIYPDGIRTKKSKVN